jgi:hypothetical protein
MGVAELEHGRAVLLRVTRSLGVEQLDYLLFPDSKSIGEMMLHVAAFEFLMVSGANFQNGEKPDHNLWLSLKPGFAREAGFDPPSGYALSHYADLLGRVREITNRYFGVSTERRMVARDDFPIRPLAVALGAGDPGGDAGAYDRLAAGVGTSIVDDGPKATDGRTDLVALLQLHESYHRGQITFQKYVYSRMHARTS